MSDQAGGAQARSSVLLVEDDPRLGPLLTDALSPSFAVEWAADGEAGLARALAAEHDVLVVDRRLPGLDGMEIVRRVRRARIVVPILMLTALGTTADKVSGLDAGANDYLVKPFDFDELSARLRALTRRFDPRGAGIEVGEWMFYPEDGCIVSPYIGRIMLTERESALLGLLARNPEVTFTRQRILRDVFSPEDKPGTVDTYVHYLRSKVDRDVVMTVRRRGYRLGVL